MASINRNNVSKRIFTFLNDGVTSFVIYPYGEKGKLVKEVLNEVYGIRELAIVDNYLSKADQSILDINELEKIQGNYIILLSSDKEDIYDEIRKALCGDFAGKVCDLAQIRSEEDLRNDFGTVGVKLNIDSCTDEQKKEIFEETKKAWKKLGEEEPYWSVVTHDEYKTENLSGRTIDKFYRSGMDYTYSIISALLRNDKIYSGGGVLFNQRQRYPRNWLWLWQGD